MMNPRQEKRKSGKYKKRTNNESSLAAAAQATHDPHEQLVKPTSQLTATAAQILNVSNETTCQASNEKLTTKTMKTKTKASNLIVKMINDVSKTISDDNSGGARRSTVTVTTPTTTTTTTIAGDSIVCMEDFPINETYTGKSDKKLSDSSNNETAAAAAAATFADASKMSKPTIAMKRAPPRIKGESTADAMTALNYELTAMSGEKISQASGGTKAPTKAKTTPTKRISETKGRTTSAAITKKSPNLRKNKCSANAAPEISSTRATVANRTSASPIYGRNYSTTTSTTTTTTAPTSSSTTATSFSNKWRQASIRCELLESKDRNQTLPKSGHFAPTSTTTVLSLAEQKAKLRSEFFKDIAKGAKAPKSSGKLAVSKTEEAGRQESTTSKRLLKRCTNLKLKIAKINDEKPSEKDTNNKQPTVLEPATKLSLIEERKQKLTLEFERQTAVKIASNQREQQPLQEFRRVAQLVKHFDKNQRKMIVNPNKEKDQAEQMFTLKPEAPPNQRHSSPLSDEGCNLGQSPYSSDDEHDNEDNVSIRTASTTIETLRVNIKSKDKVARSASSDSALGLEVDEPMDTTTGATATPPIEPPTQHQKRRMTLTVTDLPLRPALLPLAEPTTLPDSPNPEIQPTLQNLLSQSSVPTKVILEERVVEIPEDPLRSALAPVNASHADSRRESAQSSFSDYPFGDATPGVRYMRTPSVVVSDYSDEVMCGITLEEIEYFRAQRLRRRSSLDIASADREGDAQSQSDVSAASSCSNLYYCGSTISALDGAECLVNGRRMQLERKISDCSTCSASGNEDETTSTSSSAFTLTEDNASKDIADLLAAQHLSSKRAKKVGGANELDFYDNRI